MTREASQCDQTCKPCSVEARRGTSYTYVYGRNETIYTRTLYATAAASREVDPVARLCELENRLEDAGRDMSDTDDKYIIHVNSSFSNHPRGGDVVVL